MRTTSASAILVRSGIIALFVEGALWSAIRFLSFIYVLAQEAELGPRHQTAGWVRLRVVVITIVVAAVIFRAGGALRNGAGRTGRAAQILAAAANIVVLALGGAAATRFSGAEAEGVALAVVLLASASIAGLTLDLYSAFAHRHHEIAAGRA